MLFVKRFRAGTNRKHSVLVHKVQRKLNRLKGEKAIVINLIKRTEANIKESADEMVIQVPYLIDSESGTINFKIIEEIGELIL